VQVFETSAWDALKVGLKQALAAKGPLTVRLQLNVLSNESQGIAGGYTADTLWIFNGGELAFLLAILHASALLLTLLLSMTVFIAGQKGRNILH
jgi:hypothetical protein